MRNSDRRAREDYDGGTDTITVNEKEIIKTPDGFEYVLSRKYRAAYGFGEKFDSVNQKGKIVSAHVEERCFRQGEKTYLSMPFLVTPDGFGLYVDTYVDVTFDCRDEDKIVVSFQSDSFGNKAKIYLFEGSVKEIIKQFRTLTGMPRTFPKWALGCWMSSNRWDNQAEVERQAALAKENGFPHSVLVVERWSDLTTHYLFYGAKIPYKAGNEPTRYDEFDFSTSENWQDPKKMIEKLHADGIRVLLWTVPIFAQDTAVETDQNLEKLERDNDYVIEHGECVLNADGTPYKIPHTWCVGAMLPDFTKAEASKHWLDKHAYLKDIGVDGFKTDGGEFVHDPTVRFGDGKTGLEGKNAYSSEYTRAFAEFIGEDGVVFSRSGGVSTPTFSIVWAGGSGVYLGRVPFDSQGGAFGGTVGGRLLGLRYSGIFGVSPLEGTVFKGGAGGGFYADNAMAQRSGL